MQINFKATNYELTQEIKDFATKKLSVISKFVSEGAEVYLELGRETEAHVHGRVWRAEINLDQEGKQVRATATEESLEDAIDRAIGDLSRELRSDKSRRESLARRGGSALKAMLRGFRS